MQFWVEIDTQWNVNKWKECGDYIDWSVEIDTQWNVNYICIQCKCPYRLLKQIHSGM